MTEHQRLSFFSSFFAGISATFFPFFMISLVGLLVFTNDQFIDLVYQIDDEGPLKYQIAYCFALSWCSLLLWWSARYIFYRMASIRSDSLNYHRAPLKAGGKIRAVDAPSPGISPFVAEWLPRIYASLLPLLLAISAYLRSQYYAMAISLVAGILVTLFVIYRPYLMWLIVKRTNQSATCDHLDSEQSKHWILRSRTWLLIGGFIYLIVLIVALADPASLGRLFGTLASILVGIGSITVTLTLLMYTVGHRIIEAIRNWLPILKAWSLLETPYPILTLTFLYAIVVSMVIDTDNHAVRRIPEKEFTFAYPTFNDAWNQFKDQSHSPLLSISQSGRKFVPVFFVANQGGGLRASYWSTLVLAELERRIPGFHRNVFIAAGVSGGSVGSVFYAPSVYMMNGGYSACRQRDSSQETSAPPQETGTPSQETNHPSREIQLGLNLKEGLHQSVGRDYLSPVATSMLYNDLLYRFFPINSWNFLSRDRAAVLEKSWENGFNDTWGENCLGIGVNAFYKKAKEESFWTPIIMSMGAHQETGSVLITAPFPIESTVFVDKYDIFRQMHCMTSDANPAADSACDLRLSTMALNAARFPYVTPPGTINNEQAPVERRHIIDGGYVENFGLSSIRDMIGYLRQTGKLEQDSTLYVPVVIAIPNDQELTANYFNITRHNPEPDSAPLPFTEITSPLQGILSSRSGGTVYSVAQTIDYMKRIDVNDLPPSSKTSCDAPELSKNMYVVRLSEGDNFHVPLGWWLSEPSMDHMQKQAVADSVANCALDRLIDNWPLKSGHI
ncbi:hypothetical protein BTA51_14595 [Hahella sp. CCB-MM4]|uniref:patatin-like phospholipase family protein n=1 Tax=Hahella sp. (strain CCB-MM4) TaxID=1926491 RepID=UPI000B9B29FB|nr:patatin-like phospholipase family protein [Hahella sp. CCB-MM4]OZG72748.1 hypothetical protein BTA51_14595 [Hahella sp. CCB-MM4]